MYRRTLKRVFLGFLFLLILVSLFGRVSFAASNAGQTAADFLLIGVGARAAGMGGANSAVSDGVDAAYWNPAGLTSVNRGEVILGHFSWYQDIKMEHGSVAWQVSDKTTLAVSISYLGYGTIDGRDVNGVSLGEISAYDFYSGVSAGYALSPEISVGFTGKFITQKLDDLNGSSFAVDIGGKYQQERFSVAAVLINMGPDMDFDGVVEPLPSAGRLGVAVRPVKADLLTSIELEKRFHGGSVIRQGFEFGFSDQYFIRSGYNYYPGQDNRSFGTGITFGAGVQFGRAQLDYAYTPSEHYSSEDLHRFSLVFKITD
ncbi:MAG: PorV/PorQ family protein [candidate division Zixibacteria bacterium]|nr:PorV/PorQ family protein [candidate division Zixibacteria bacterium]